MKRRLMVLLAMLGLALPCDAATWYVDKDNSSGLEVGTAWSTAFTTIQPAIDAAFEQGGGQVWVAGGVYDEERVATRTGYPENTGALLMKEGVHLYGGFTGEETYRETRDYMAHATVIDGAKARSGEAAYNVVIAADDATLDGFTIRDGNALHGPRGHTGAAGLRIEGVSPVVRNCLFENNTADSGGAIINSGSPLIENCVFRANSAGQVGGAISSRGFPLIVNCVFEDNSAGSSGGAIRFFGKSTRGTVTNCVFENNRARIGGAFVNASSSQIFRNCIFRNNEATEYSGAAHIGDTRDTQFINCVFDSNTAGISNGALYAGGTYDYYSNTYTTNGFLAYCTFYGNTAGLRNGSVSFGYAAMGPTRCIFWANSPNDGLDDPFEHHDDPLFVDAPNGDFHLQRNSPAIDVSTTLSHGVTDDFEGTPRPQGDGYDLGAYEYVEAPIPDVILTTSLTGSGTVEPSEGVYKEGATVTLTATPAEGWAFDHWEGDLTGTDNPADLLMDADRSVMAIFMQQFNLSLTVHGDGTIAPSNGVFIDGTTVSLTATADVGWVFDHWDGDLTGATNPADLLMDADRSVTAIFLQQFTLTTSVEGLGTIDPTGGASTDGDILTLTAAPEDGWVFDHWEGALTHDTNPADLSIDADQSVTAVFLEQFTLTVAIEGNGTVDPDGGTYTGGDVVTLTATSGEGWEFRIWSGDLTTEENSATLLMEADKSVTAEFSETPLFECTAAARPHSRGTNSRGDVAVLLLSATLLMLAHSASTAAGDARKRLGMRRGRL